MLKMDKKIYLKVEYNEIVKIWLKISDCEREIRHSHNTIETTKKLDEVRKCCDDLRDMLFFAESAK